jgi:Domain of unknown function (DUF4282)
MNDFLAFRRMITPIIIQIIFWIFAIGFFIGGIVTIATSDDGGAAQIVSGIFLIILGPLFVRIACEMVILFFRMNETLTEIKNNTKK